MTAEKVNARELLAKMEAEESLPHRVGFNILTTVIAFIVLQLLHFS